MAEAATALPLALKGGEAIGSAAKGGPSQTNIPPFYSPGGITPEQEALAQYGMNEANVATGETFGASGTGMSTMATQAGTGNRMGKAVAEGSMSDTDEDAMYKAYQNEQTAEIQGLQNQSTLSNLATQQLTSAINTGSSAATTAQNNSDFSAGVNSITGGSTPNTTG
jgi:hypothetical protein